MVKLAKEIIEAAQGAQRDWGVPAAVTLAQFGQESAWGLHMPLGSNNPFGIKARTGEEHVLARTLEVFHGRRVYVTAPFRKFASFAEAFEAHGQLLNRPQFGHAMMLWTLQGNLDAYVSLMARTYATDPHYAREILGLIASQGLLQYNLPGHQKGLKT